MRWLSATVALVTLALSASATASTPDDSARAEALFEEGLRLFNAGQTAKACAKFQDSYTIDPGLGTLQNLALCHEKEGRLVLAYDELTLLLTKAQAAGKTQRLDVALDHLAALDPKVPHVVLSFAEGVHVTAVEVDGVARDWRAPIALEAGHHRIAARAEGHADAHVDYDAKTGGTQAVKVDFPGDVARPPLPVRPQPPPPALDTHKLVVFGVAGLAGAGIIVGSAFGALTFAQKSGESGHCSGQFCDATGLAADSRAHTSATVSTVGFTVGVVLLAVDAVLVLSTRKASSTGLLGGPREPWRLAVSF